MLLLFWLRHYLPVRALAVIFHLSKSQIHDILMNQLKIVEEHQERWIDLYAWEIEDAPAQFPKHIGVVDCTEVTINNWQRNCFSKKKGHQTLKYQVVINIQNSRVLNVFGPYKGARHDSKVFNDSFISNWLPDHNVHLLGDRAYVGIDHITSPMKRKKGQSRWEGSKQEDCAVSGSNRESLCKSKALEGPKSLLSWWADNAWQNLHSLWDFADDQRIFEIKRKFDTFTRFISWFYKNRTTHEAIEFEDTSSYAFYMLWFFLDSLLTCHESLNRVEKKETKEITRR